MTDLEFLVRGYALDHLRRTPEVVELCRRFSDVREAALDLAWAWRVEGTSSRADLVVEHRRGMRVFHSYVSVALHVTIRWLACHVAQFPTAEAQDLLVRLEEERHLAQAAVQGLGTWREVQA